MTLEERLYVAGFPELVRKLNAELTIYTKRRGAYAVFVPRAAISIEDGKLALGHPMGSKIYFERTELLAIQSGVSVSPHYEGQTFRRLVEHL